MLIYSICLLFSRLSPYLSTDGVWTFSPSNTDLVPFQNIYWVLATGRPLWVKNDSKHGPALDVFKVWWKDRHKASHYFTRSPTVLLQGDSYQCWYQLFSQQFLHLYLDGQELQETYLICVFVLFWQILLFNWTPEDVLSTRVQFQTQSLLQNPGLKWHTVLLLEVILLLLVVLGTFGPSMKQSPFSEVDNHVSIWKQ